METKIHGPESPRDQVTKFFRLAIGSRISKVIAALEGEIGAAVSPPSAAIIDRTKAMKNLERFTLMTVTTVCAGYLIQRTCRNRAERIYRLAAGESPYERTHHKHRGTKHS